MPVRIEDEGAPGGQQNAYQTEDSRQTDDGRQTEESSSTSRSTARRRGTLSTRVNEEDIELSEEEDADEDVQRAMRPVAGAGLFKERVPLKALQEHLRDQVRRDRKCRNIPAVILYTVFFNLMLLTHEHFSDTSQVEREVRAMMTGSSFEGYTAGPPGSGQLEVSGHSVLEDIDQVEVFDLFLREALIPALIPGQGAVGADAQSRTFRYNRLLGGLQLEQTRRGRRDCASLYPAMGPKNDFNTNPFLNGFSCFRSVPNDDTCFGPGAAVEGFCRRNASAGHGRRLSGAVEQLSYLTSRLALPLGSPPYTLVMHEGQGTEVALRRWQELMDAGWIDEQSEWVGMRFFLLNPDVAVYCITQVHVFFLLTGELLTKVDVTTFMAEPYQRRSVLIVDATWVMFLLQLLLGCIFDLFSALRKPKGSLRRYCLNPWTWLGWACAIFGVLVVILWVVYLDKLEAAKASALEVAVNRPPDMSGSPPSPEVMRTYTDSVERLFANVNDVDAYLVIFRFYLSCYNLLLVFRFFEAFLAQPRLAIVTDTLLRCLPDFLHFMLVFVTLLVVFAVSATFLFGHRLAEFSYVSWSIERCLLLLFGDLDYGRLAGENPAITFIWFGLYMTLMFLVMLNMCLAVIIDVYSGEKTRFHFSESIFHQLFRFAQRSLLPAKEVLACVEELNQRTISGPELEAACPGMSEQQSLNLIERVADSEANDYCQVVSISDTTRVVVAMKQHVAKLTIQVDAILSAQERTQMCMREAMGYASVANPEEPLVMLDSQAQRRLSAVESRLNDIEELLDDALKYAENRGRGIRDGLRTVEELLQNRRGC